MGRFAAASLGPPKGKKLGVCDQGRAEGRLWGGVIPPPVFYPLGALGWPRQNAPSLTEGPLGSPTHQRVGRLRKGPLVGGEPDFLARAIHSQRLPEGKLLEGSILLYSLFDFRGLHRCRGGVSAATGSPRC